MWQINDRDDDGDWRIGKHTPTPRTGPIEDPDHGEPTLFIVFDQHRTSFPCFVLTFAYTIFTSSEKIRRILYEGPEGERKVNEYFC